MNWHCPNCGLTEQTKVLPNRFHVCPKLHGLTAPMLPGGVAGKVEVQERGDYVGTEKVFVAPNGRPIMSVVTTRDNGMDTTVFAPTATGGSK